METEAGGRQSFSHLLDWVKGKRPDWDPRSQFGDVEAFFRRHLEVLRKGFELQPFDILGHGSLLPPLALGDPETVYPAWWEDGLVDFLHASGVAMEISNRWRQPYPRLMRKAVAAGLRFAAGSDGHETDRSCRLDYPQQLIVEYGLGPARIFDVPRLNKT
jgi:histidinol phosphatase-like PHP family hydrolase